MPSHRHVFMRLSIWTMLSLALVALPTWADPAPPTPDLERQLETLTKTFQDWLGKPAPSDARINPDWMKAPQWRCVGPASMGGRITALAVFEADPSCYYAATASGGLLKTVNNGVTFEHQFDKEATVSIGDVAVAPSDRNIVWVGTGENNPRNSVSFGDGVYKSVDGGKSWQHMGLRKTFQIGRIAIHPKDPNVVYVGALGRLYGPNEDRGLFKTTDGGKTWDKIHYIDDKTGVIDLALHPTDPDTLYVASWERLRDEYDNWLGEPKPPETFAPYDPIKKYGPGGGIFKTSDGGKTFRKLTKGLPTNALGRIGLDIYRKDPNTLFALIDCEKIGMGPPQGDPGFLGVQGEDAETGARLTQVTKDGPADKAGLKTGDIVLSVNDKLVLSYKQMVDQLQARKAGDKVTFKVARQREAKELAITLGKRPGPRGKPEKWPFSSWLGGQEENIQDKQGPDGHEYGGVYKSTDAGESWTRVNSLNPRPMYFSVIRVDPADDKYLYIGGIRLHRSKDGGKTFTADGSKEVHPDMHALWINPRDGRHMIVGSDGGPYATYDRMDHWDFLNHMALGQFYHVSFDTRKPYHVYGGLQDNGSWGGPSQVRRAGGIINEDWIMVTGGDGFVCRVDTTDPDLVYSESQNGNFWRSNIRTGEFSGLRVKGPVNAPYRFNWNTPFQLSHHNPRIMYTAGNYVFRSVKQGTDLKPISPEITRTKRGSATAFAESPRNPDVLWVGSDDGALWLTRDGGAKWTNALEKLKLPGPRCVASIEASRFADGRAYVAFDAHRSDDDEPYVYVTEDFGQSWKSLRANLPTGSTRCFREDVINPNLLYVGTEFTAWASVDRGVSWHRLGSNLPTVAVHEIAVHPTAGEIVAATHGRSLWILDVTALRQMTPEVIKSSAHLYEPAPAVRWRTEPPRGSIYGAGSRRFLGQNPPRGAQFFYSLAKKADKVTLKVTDIDGKTVRDLQAKGDAGLQRVVWDLRGKVAGTPGDAPVPTGVYKVVLTVDGVAQSRAVRVEPDPNVPAAVDRDVDDFKLRGRVKVVEDD